MSEGIRRIVQRVRVAWLVLRGGPVVRLHDGGSLTNADVFGGILVDDGNVVVSNCTLGPAGRVEGQR